MSCENIRYRRLFVVMDDFDDAMLSFALKDAFPTALFLQSGRGLTTPALEKRPTIAECKSVASIVVPPPGWEPRFRPYDSRARSYVITNWPRHSVHYARCTWFRGAREPAKWSFSLPSPNESQIVIHFDPAVEEDMAFTRAFRKVLNRLTTDRMKGGLRKGRRVLTKDVRGGNFRAGPHVLDWCRQQPDRMLAGHTMPCDDWAPPDSPWHRDLYRRVIERYGPDFGGPPPTPPHLQALADG